MWPMTVECDTGSTPFQKGGVKAAPTTGAQDTTHPVSLTATAGTGFY